VVTTKGRANRGERGGKAEKKRGGGVRKRGRSTGPSRGGKEVASPRPGDQGLGKQRLPGTGEGGSAKKKSTV